MSANISVASNSNPRVYFPNLDGLRFFCFLSVFLFHSFGSLKIDMEQYAIYRFVEGFLFENGVLGVNFFFVLSGFLITYLLLVEKANFKKVKIANFYVRRVLRIWPLFYFCVLFGFFIFPILKEALGEVPDEPARLPFYLTFLSNFDVVYNASPDASVLGILWSVSIEEQFYLVWPLIIAFTPRKAIPFALTAILLASFFFRLAHADSYRIMTLHTFSCISDMVVGGIFAYFSLYNKNFIDRIRSAPRLMWILLYISVGIIYLFTTDIFHQNSISYAFERLVIAILFALVIVEQSYADHSLFKMGNFKLVSKLGTYTYGLYCLHPIAGLVANKGLWLLGINTNLFGIMVIEPIVSFSLAIIMAIVSYHYFESPFLKLKEKFARVTRAQPV